MKNKLINNLFKDQTWWRQKGDCSKTNRLSPWGEATPTSPPPPPKGLKCSPASLEENSGVRPSGLALPAEFRVGYRGWQLQYFRLIPTVNGRPLLGSLLVNWVFESPERTIVERSRYTKRRFPREWLLKEVLWNCLHRSPAAGEGGRENERE